MKYEDAQFTAYITRYALTNGILQKLVAPLGTSSGSVFVINDELPKFYHGNDWHRTLDEAVKRAEEMRATKIASLEKQIAKLRKLSFGGSNA